MKLWLFCLKSRLWREFHWGGGGHFVWYPTIPRNREPYHVNWNVALGDLSIWMLRPRQTWGLVREPKPRKTITAYQKTTFPLLETPSGWKFHRCRYFKRTGVRAALYHTISRWYVCFVHQSCQYSDDDCLVNRSFMSFNEELSASQSHKQKTRWCLEWHYLSHDCCWNLCHLIEAREDSPKNEIFHRYCMQC